jgi:ATP-dependent protease ClpP protease subunit
MNSVPFLASVLLVAAGFWAAPSPTSPISNVLIKRDRALFIYGPLTGSNLSVPSFFSQAERLRENPSTSPVYVLVSSEGGDIDIGRQMHLRLNQLKLKGIDVVCTVVDTAQSAAFYLLPGCSRRLTLKSSKFMMHQIRWSITNALLNAQDLARGAAELDMLNNSTVRDLILSMKPPLQKKFQDDYFATKEWTGEQLAKEFPNWIQLVDTIIYVD